MKTLKKLSAPLLLCSLALNAFAQTTVLFPLAQMTGTTNDTTITIKPVNNPVSWHSQVYWLPTAGIQLKTLNGSATTNLIPNDYHVTIAGVPASWRISVNDTNVTLNAAEIGDLTTYAFTQPFPGVEKVIAGDNVTISPPSGMGIVTINSTGGNGGSAANAFRSQSSSAALTIVTNLTTFVYTYGLAANLEAWANWSTNAFASLFDTNGAAAAVKGYADSISNSVAPWVNWNTNVFGSAAFQPTNTFDLAGTAIAATNDLVQIAPFAMAFAKTNRLYDDGTISDLRGFEGELRKAGVFTNLVDAVFLKPRFNPTNALSFFGRPLLMTNLSYSQFGAQFTSATSSVTLNNLPDCRTNTIIMVYRFTNPAGFALSQTMNYAVGLGNTSNGGGFFAAHIPGKYSLVFQRSTTATPFPIVQNGFTNLVQYPNLNGNYDFAHNEHSTTRYVFGLSSDGQGNMSAWNNGIICALSRSGTTAFSLNDPDPVTNSLTRLRIGSDMEGGSAWGDVLAQFPGEIAAVLVFNKAATTNLIVAATVATRWLEPETMERLYVGDSRWADGASPSMSTTNQNPIWYFQQHRPSDVCWRNESTFNSTFASANSAFGSNLLFGVPLPSKVTEKQIYCELGINDVYASGLTGSNIFYNGLLTFRTNAAANGWNIYASTVYPVGSNATAYTYDSAKDLQRSNLNNAVLTNAYLFSGVWHLDQVYTFSVMDTNNGYSLDGVHVTDTNGWIPAIQAANMFYGGYWQDASNRDASQLTGILPMTSLSTNIVVGTGEPWTIGQALVITGTNASGQFLVKGTNFPVGGGGGDGTVTSVDAALNGFTSSGAVTGSGTITLTRSADSDYLGFGAQHVGFVNVSNLISGRGLMITNGMTNAAGTFYSGGNLTNVGTVSITGNSTNFADTYLRGALNVAGGFTNSALTASTLLQSDANKKLSSIANGTGVLTNNGSGGLGYDNTFAHTNQMLGTGTLTANSHVKLNAGTNVFSSEDFAGYTNSIAFTNFAGTTNIVLPSDNAPHVGLITNGGPNIFISFAGNAVGSWTFWITTNTIHFPPQVHVLGYSNLVVTNAIFDIQPFGGTNRVIGAQSEQ